MKPEITVYVLLDGTLAARQKFSERVFTCAEWPEMLLRLRDIYPATILRVAALSPRVHVGGSI